MKPARPRTRTLRRRLPILPLALLTGGCTVMAVGGAVVGAAVSVTGAVVSTGIELTGKAVGAGIDALSSGDKTDAAGSAVTTPERPASAPAGTPEHGPLQSPGPAPGA